MDAETAYFGVNCAARNEIGLKDHLEVVNATVRSNGIVECDVHLGSVEQEFACGFVTLCSSTFQS